MQASSELSVMSRYSHPLISFDCRDAGYLVLLSLCPVALTVLACPISVEALAIPPNPGNVRIFGLEVLVLGLQQIMDF